MQVGTVLSVAPKQWGCAVGESNSGSNWIVVFSYALDAGGKQQGEAIVGAGSTAVVALWSSPSSSITLPFSSTPGTSNQVTLVCPALIRWAAFGAALGGVTGA